MFPICFLNSLNKKEKSQDCYPVNYFALSAFSLSEASKQDLTIKKRNDYFKPMVNIFEKFPLHVRKPGIRKSYVIYFSKQKRHKILINLYKIVDFHMSIMHAQYISFDPN